jgi:hypothetical protein
MDFQNWMFSLHESTFFLKGLPSLMDFSDTCMVVGSAAAQMINKFNYFYLPHQILFWLITVMGVQGCRQTRKPKVQSSPLPKRLLSTVSIVFYMNQT